MDPTTKNIKFDISPRIRSGPSWVSTDSELTFFYEGLSTDELLSDYFTGRSSKEVDLLVSTSEQMTHPDTKVLILVSEKFYHFFIDSLPLIFKIHRSNPEAKIVLYLKMGDSSPQYENFLSLLYRVLDGEGINYSKIFTVKDSELAPAYKFNNYVVLDNRTVNLHTVLSFSDIKYSTDLLIRYCNPNGKDSLEHLNPPHRKVYMPHRGSLYGGDIPAEYEYYRDDSRMEDEYKLQEFFVGMGYEIFNYGVTAETIEDQINYMTEVKTLVSLTSSGLTNMIFMQTGQTVVEIQAEIVLHIHQEQSKQETLLQRLHPFYQVLGFMRDHLFISVPSNRDPDKVIETLTSDRMGGVL
jgi:hypothetical protein